MGIECSFIIRKCKIPFFVKYDFMNWEPFLCYFCAEQKQQKVSEIKAALDDADVLVLCGRLPFYFLC